MFTIAKDVTNLAIKALIKANLPKDIQEKQKELNREFAICQLLEARTLKRKMKRS